MQFREKIHQAYTVTSRLWHERLSHINLKYLKETIKQNAATRIKLEELQEDLLSCDACHLGKETRKPFERKEKLTKLKPGVLLHADLSGTMPVASIGGAQYFIAFKDDAAGFRAV
jgi:GTP cyclohydrolase II